MLLTDRPKFQFRGPLFLYIHKTKKIVKQYVGIAISVLHAWEWEVIWRDLIGRWLRL
jgi:hypothetical protein